MFTTLLHIWTTISMWFPFRLKEDVWENQIYVVVCAAKIKSNDSTTRPFHERQTASCSRKCLIIRRVSKVRWWIKFTVGSFSLFRVDKVLLEHCCRWILWELHPRSPNNSLLSLNHFLFTFKEHKIVPSSRNQPILLNILASADCEKGGKLEVDHMWGVNQIVIAFNPWTALFSGFRNSIWNLHVAPCSNHGQAKRFSRHSTYFNVENNSSPRWFLYPPPLVSVWRWAEPCRAQSTARTDWWYNSLLRSFGGDGGVGLVGLLLYT